jgi:hypothetical protein
MEVKKECDYCEETEGLEKIGLDGLVCPKCKAGGIHASNQRQIEASLVLAKLKSVDEAIKSKDDIFNAPTPAIMDIQAAINADETITNKPFEIAKLIKELIAKRQQTIFDHNQIIKAEVSSQKEEQSYFNRLSNTLREEERKQLGIVDIHYRPQAPKIQKVKIPKAPKTRFDKELLREYAAKINALVPGIMAEALLQAQVLQKGMTIQAAAEALLNQITAAKKGEPSNGTNG